MLITTNGQPDPGFNGEQDVTFAITSLAHGSLRLIAYRDAEPIDNADPSRARCSGRFETTTGIYQDVFRLEDTLFDLEFRLSDGATMDFELLDGETL